MKIPILLEISQIGCPLATGRNKAVDDQHIGHRPSLATSLTSNESPLTCRLMPLTVRRSNHLLGFARNSAIYLASAARQRNIPRP